MDGRTVAEEDAYQAHLNMELNRQSIQIKFAHLTFPVGMMVRLDGLRTADLNGTLGRVVNKTQYCSLEELNAGDFMPGNRAAYNRGTHIWTRWPADTPGVRNDTPKHGPIRVAIRLEASGKYVGICTDNLMAIPCENSTAHTSTLGCPACRARRQPATVIDHRGVYQLP
jgi:hypothetical protein